ncbi:MAG: GC-type dockerin domain-anchored protein [Phycisphaerales bacterium]
MRLANDLNRAYQDGLIDSIWVWEPKYPDVTVIQECWYTLASQLYRLNTKPADYNLDGAITPTDLNAFIAVWTAADPTADFNNDGQITIQDFYDFLAAWMAG